MDETLHLGDTMKGVIRILSFLDVFILFYYVQSMTSVTSINMSWAEMMLVWQLQN